jgi:hypothetical protein
MNFDDLRPLLTQIGTDAVSTMQANLKRKIRRVGKLGAYDTDTIATGKLYKALRYTVQDDLFGIELNVYGTKYWQNADAGTPAGTKVNAPALVAWSQAKAANSGYPMQTLTIAQAASLSKRIQQSGTLSPPSRFATDAITGLQPAIDSVPSFASRLVTDEMGRIADLANKLIETLDLNP